MLDLTPVRLKNPEEFYPFVFEKGDLPANWDSICPFLEASVRASFNMISIDTLQEMLFEGQAVCIGTAQAGEPVFVTVTHPVQYSGFRTARVIAAAGSQLKQSMKFFHVLETWAMSLGITEIEAWCRPGMTRVLSRYGFKHRVSIITRKIERAYQ